MTEKSSEPSELENRIVEVLASNTNKDGVSQVEIQKALPSLQPKELASVLNSLIAQDKLKLKRKGNQLLYVYNPDGKIIKGSTEEQVILKIIENAKDNGVAANEIRRESGLPQQRVTKLLKELVNEKRIKLVVAKNKKKLYLLHHIEPSVEITGGAFYTDDEFEVDFVNALAEQSYKYLLRAKGLADKLLDPVSQRLASFKTSKEICDYINALKISKVPLKVSDIEKILQSLIYDGKIVKNSSLALNKGSENCYAISNSMLSSVGLMRMPCGVCPVFEECGPGLAVSPATCEYMKEWLEF